jgi:4a-hydroxytetrahydrobiopterin dehydratase
MDVYNEVTAQPIKDLNDWKFNDNGIEKKVFKISVRHLVL